MGSRICDEEQERAHCASWLGQFERLLPGLGRSSARSKWAVAMTNGGLSNDGHMANSPTILAADPAS